MQIAFHQYELVRDSSRYSMLWIYVAFLLYEFFRVFLQDNSYISMDYRSPNILNLDNVERLCLSKNDIVLVSCKKSNYEDKIWYMGTHDEVAKQVQEAERVMNRNDDGETINLSEIFISQEVDVGHRETENVAESPNVSMSFMD